VEGDGARINVHRAEALRGLQVVDSLDQAVERVTQQWGAKPLIVATSARGGEDRITFAQARKRLTRRKGPMLLIFGTSWGLADEAMAKADWVIEPIGAPSDYNHLSVRSAASIVVDRLFG
jgi:hypothetical protein